MAEIDQIQASEPADSGFSRLKRKIYENRWWIVFVLAGFSLFTLPNWGRGRNFGWAAWVCSIAVAFPLNAFWSARRERWFWITAAFIVVVHIVFLLSVHWTNTHYFGATYRAYGEIDFIATYAILWMAREIATLVSPPDTRAKGPTR